MTAHEPDRLDDALLAWAEDRTAPPIDGEEARRRADLIGVRAGERLRARSRAVTLASLAAVAALILGGVGLQLLPGTDTPVERPPQPTLPAVPVQASAAPPEIPVVRAPADAPMEIELRDDIVRLAAGSELRLPPSPAEATRVELVSGSLSATVEQRTEGESFVVVAGAVEVRVVGTRFSVSREPGGVDVAVEEGVVEVSDGEGAWTVRAGSELRWRDGRAEIQVRAPAPAAPAPRPAVVVPTPEPTDTFDLAAVSGRLLSGEVQEAIAELEARVALAPADMKAWTLLATAYRRAGDDPLALDAWLRAVDLGSGLGVNRARYEAATLLQARGDHGGAAVQLEAILADTAGAGALEADARLRLGRSLLAIGREGDARAEWSLVVRRFPGTTAATSAARLLTEPGG